MDEAPTRLRVHAHIQGEEREQTGLQSVSEDEGLVGLILWIVLVFFLAFPVLNLFALIPAAPHLSAAAPQQTTPFSLLLELIGSAFATSSYPLIGMLLLILVGMVKPDDPRAARWLSVCRQLSTLAMAGYLLFIPLQIVAILQMNSDQIRGLDRSIASLEALERRVGESSSSSELNRVIERRPELARLGLSSPSVAPFEPFKIELQRSITKRLWQQRENRLLLQIQRGFRDVGTFLQGAFLSALLAMIYAIFSLPMGQASATRLVQPWQGALRGLASRLAGWR